MMPKADNFKDHFSRQAPQYRRYRPGYPDALFTWLAGLTAEHQLAWDCATGSGQAAVGLAPFFAGVVATDAADSQIQHAEACANVEYRTEAAEAVSLAAGSVDLITVAQALHWFDLERFYAQVRRVLKPGGVIAAWTYDLLRISPPIDALLAGFYTDTLGAYWPAERRHVENGYANLPFPFTILSSPTFHMQAQWSLPELMGYLSTWSALKRYQAAHRHDPLPALTNALATHWGAGRRAVQWPLAVKAGRLDIPHSGDDNHAIST